MTISKIKYNSMTAKCIRDAINWWITDNYPELLDDELVEAQEDFYKQEEAIEAIITYLQEDYEL